MTFMASQAIIAAWVVAFVTAADVKLGIGWAPSQAEAIGPVLDWANVTHEDTVYELGCGDGRVAIQAARRGARVVCIDGDRQQLRQAREAARLAGVESAIEMRLADAMDTGLSQATVAYIFLLPTLLVRLLPAIEQMPPGARVIVVESEIYGWPCGERMRWPPGAHFGLFTKWTLPVARLEPLADSGLPTLDDETAIIEHLLACTAEGESRRRGARSSGTAMPEVEL